MPIKMPAFAGKAYRPANGTEAALFETQWCGSCSKEATCDIMLTAWAYDADEPDYPPELVFDSRGEPECTAHDKQPR